MNTDPLPRLLAWAALLVFEPAGAGEPAKSFHVTSIADLPDADPGDGACNALPATAGQACTLRAAVMEANTVAGEAEVHIVLVPGAIYGLTRKNVPGDGHATGDLDIERTMHIGVAAGATLGARIDANGIDRVFDIAATAGNTRLHGLDITGGVSQLGAAVYSRAVGVRLDAVDVHHNTFGPNNGYGSTIHQRGSGTMTISESRIHHNGQGQGLHATLDAGGAALQVDRSAIDSNHGSGIDTHGGAALLVVHNSSIAGNHGDGIVLGQTMAMVKSSTIGENGANEIRFGTPGAGAVIGNSILRSAGPGVNCAGLESGHEFSASYNLYSDHSCLSSTADNSEHGVALADMPEFGFWGGPTPSYRPEPGSIAIDFSPATQCGGLDQRGFPRPVAHEGSAEPRCDAGAVELQPPVVFPPEPPWVKDVFSDGFESQ